jgi:polyhydroxyalkanoate synthesis regulator phasin
MEGIMAARLAFKERLKEARETGRAKILQLEDEAQKLVQRVVARGRDAQAEGKKRLEKLVAKSELMERVRDADVYQRVQSLRSEVEDRLEGGMDRLLDAFGVATKGELEKLSKRLDGLSTKLGEISKIQKSFVKSVKRSKGAAKSR